MVHQRALSLAVTLVFVTTAGSLAQQSAPNQETNQKSATAKVTVAKATVAKVTAEQQAMYDAFAKKLSGAVLVGNFTIDGKPEKREERYTIRKVTKMEKGEYWLFEARIAYGDKDVTVPMPLIVKWAGKTPVITLDNVKIPKLGTFDARVLIDGDRYAGTWQHDSVGGLMFGRIERAEAEKGALNENR